LDPIESIKNEIDRLNNKADVFEANYFSENYPLAWAYLNEHKEALEKRSLQGNNPAWYQFSRSQSLTRFHDSEKLIWSVLATNPPYSLDNRNLQFTGGGNGPYYALINNSEYSLLYFLGILSHPIIENMVKAGASEFRGAYYSHGKQFIENLPIRLIDFKDNNDKRLYKTIIKTVTNLISTKQQFNNGTYGANRTVLQRKLNMLQNRLMQTVNQLYNITNNEFNVVINDDMFLSELTIEE